MYNSMSSEPSCVTSTQLKKHYQLPKNPLHTLSQSLSSPLEVTTILISNTIELVLLLNVIEMKFYSMYFL